MSVPQRSSLERCVRLLNTYNSYQSDIALAQDRRDNHREQAGRLRALITEKRAEQFNPLGMLGGLVNLRRRRTPTRRAGAQEVLTEGADMAAQAAALARFEADKRRSISDLTDRLETAIRKADEENSRINRFLAERERVREAMVREGCQAR
ncbi:MAG: hypothetical protein LAT81_07110 [Oceanicaulis sp.]|nr:hypothetical protein [Oceanicaulis sp.]